MRPQIHSTMLFKNMIRVLQIVASNSQNVCAANSKSYRCNRSTKESLLSGEIPDGCSGEQHFNNAAGGNVRKGFVAVYVGPELRRFVIPVSCLSKPEFRTLMEMSADEFGYEQEGGLHIPCEERDFEEILCRCMPKNKKKQLL